MGGTRNLDKLDKVDKLGDLGVLAQRLVRPLTRRMAGAE
jgi:hypothetical protein